MMLQPLQRIIRNVLLSISLLAFACCQLASAAVLVESLDEAKRHVMSGDYKGAYSRFKTMANHGCPFSQCVLGIMHQEGLGAEKSLTKAISWYEKSARQDFADAELRLGKIYNHRGNIDQAIAQFKRAARHDVPEAEYELGKIYANSGISNLAQEGKQWLQKAGAHGLQEAITLAQKIPDVPNPQSPVAPNATARGMANIEQSWTGYTALTKALEAGESR